MHQGAEIESDFVYGVRMSRRRLRRRVERRYHERAPQATAAAPAESVREASRVERLAYTRTQVADALGISRSTLNRRVLPYVDTIEMPWGTRLVPVDELERLLAERRRPAQMRPQASTRGRPRAVAPRLVARIQAEHTSGKSLGAIARDLNASRMPTAHGGAQWWPSTVRGVLRRGA